MSVGWIQWAQMVGGGLFADLEDNVEKSLPWTDEALRVPADKDEEVVFWKNTSIPIFVPQIL